MQRLVRTTLPLVSSVVIASCRSTDPARVDPSNGPALFEAVWRDFDRHYAFFEHGDIDWNAVGDIYRDSVHPATSEQETARLIGAMIGRLGDYHSGLFTPFGTFGPPPIAHPHHFDPDLVRPRYVASLSATAGNRIWYGRVDSHIGYVFIPSFEGTGWGADVEVALTGLGDITRLIIDIRDNRGGNENVAVAVAQRFYDIRRTYRVSRWRDGPAHDDFGDPVEFSVAPAGQRRFTGPTALITNRFNGSASEDFICMMRVLPHVVTIGDTTLGLGSNPLRRRLRSGWSYSISQSTQETPAGFIYQWKGLAPSLPVAWSIADTAAGRDPYIEAALSHLGTQPPSSQSKPANRFRAPAVNAR